jgi:exodeoxyribonuclease VII small subunit
MSSRDPSEAKTEPYSVVVERLDGIVTALESGTLSLEDALEKFAEGVTLVKQGEKMLADAEKRIEQLLSADGKTAPLELPTPSGKASAGKP